MKSSIMRNDKSNCVCPCVLRWLAYQHVTMKRECCGWGLLAVGFWLAQANADNVTTPRWSTVFESSGASADVVAFVSGQNKVAVMNGNMLSFLSAEDGQLQAQRIRGQSSYSFRALTKDGAYVLTAAPFSAFPIQPGGFSFSGGPGGALALSRDGSRILVGAPYGAAILYAYPGFTVVQDFAQSDVSVQACYSAALSADGKLAATGSNDGSVRVWRIGDGTLLHTLRADGTAVFALTFTADSRGLISGTFDATVHIWDAVSGVHVRQFSTGNRPFGCALSPDGKFLLIAQGDAVLWDLSQGREVRRFLYDPVPRVSSTSGITSVAFSEDGNTILTGAVNGVARLWDTWVGLKQLRVFLDGRYVTVAWPSSLSRLLLQANDSLSNPSGWRYVDAPVVLTGGGEYKVTFPAVASQRFYRLVP